MTSFTLLIKNSVTFKGQDDIKDQKLQNFEGSLKKPTFMGRLHKKKQQIITYIHFEYILT